MYEKNVKFRYRMVGILTAVLLFLSIIVLMPLEAEAADGDVFQIGSIKYTVISETAKTVEVTGYDTLAGAVTIPSEVTNNGSTYAVTEIQNMAFAYCSKMTSINIPSSVLKIDEDAFYRCTGLTNVTIPNSIKEISPYTFEYCSALTNIRIPDSVTSIGKCAFNFCTGLTSIEIPDSVISIDEEAFWTCSDLETVTIPNITDIASTALYNCSNITKVLILCSSSSETESANLAAAISNCMASKTVSVYKGVRTASASQKTGKGTAIGNLKTFLCVTDGIYTLSGALTTTSGMTMPAASLRLTGTYNAGTKITGNALVVARSESASSLTIKIYGMKNTVSVSLSPLPGKTTGLKAKRSGSKHIIKWHAVSGAKYYQLQSRVKGHKTFKTVKKAGALTKTSFKCSHISRSKTYYYRVRAYYISNGQKVYGSWSAVKVIKKI